MPYCNRLLECRIATGFRGGFVGRFGFSHKVNGFGLFCGDSIILWPNFGSNMMSIFVEGPSWIICRI